MDRVRRVIEVDVRLVGGTESALDKGARRGIVAICRRPVHGHVPTRSPEGSIVTK